MFLQDLYLLAFDCAEIRTPLLHLKGEIFRKGLDEWHAKFVAKCNVCGEIYQEDKQTCDKCGGDSFGKPDREQLEVFDAFRKNCNIFGQTLDEVCQELEDDVNICLVPGTKIFFRDGHNNFAYRNIEDIKVGTKVWTHTAKLKPVTKIYERFVDEDLVVLYLSNGEKIKITSNHPVYTKDGWVNAGELTTSHILYKLTEVHPTWSEKLKKKRPSVVDYKKRSVNIAEQQKTRKFRKEQWGVEYHGSLGHTSPKKNKTLIEFFGISRALEIQNKQKDTAIRNGSNKGAGFHFRAKVGNFFGANNPNWRDGASFIKYSVVFNARLKRKVYTRDNYTCQVCNNYPISCKCHHIDYNKKNNNEENLITLCGSCHAKTNFEREKWIDIFKTKIDEKNVKIQNGNKILKIGREHYTGYVYNLEVEEDHSYCGRGIIYHNCDDAYLMIHKQYSWINNKLFSKVIELRRIHPALMEIDLDKNGLPTNSHWLCPFHREEISTQPDRCKDCGLELIPAKYVYNHRGRRVYLFEDEMYHFSKFSPSPTYGYSPILTIMQKVLTISGMDRFLYRYFFERKAPSGMIMTYTDDPQSLETERARVEARMMEDPTYLPWIAVSQKTGRGRTDFVRLFHTLQEMDYLPVRNEIRDRVSMIYGVPQIYMNVMEGVGGLSGQTQQIKMFSNVIEADQRRYNEGIFPKLMELFNITDWEIRLRTPEEKIESVLIQQAGQKVTIASQMRMMGFDVALKSGSGDLKTMDFVFSGKPAPMDQGMGGGMPMPIDQGGQPIQEPPEAPVPEGPVGMEKMHQHGNRPPHRREQPHWPDERHRLEELEYEDEDEEDEY